MLRVVVQVGIEGRPTGFRDSQGFDLELYHRVRSLATPLKP